MRINKTEIPNERTHSRARNIFYKGIERTPVLVGDVIKTSAHSNNFYYIKEIDYDNKNYLAVSVMGNTTIEVDHRKDDVKFVRRAPYFGPIDDDTIKQLKVSKSTIIANDCYNFYKRNSERVVKYISKHFGMNVTLESKILTGDKTPTIFLKRV